ncbi:MAG: outer membrane protein transport protein [Alphaproteobacteria bacterium]|nr:outer membrane protein transport protein [Alphaproteobacteria bacterium]
MNKKLLCLALIGTCLSTKAYAAGYQISEFSAASLGRANAGMGVVGDDHSALAVNPAGMVLSNTGVQTGVAYYNVDGHVKGTYTPGTGEPARNGKTHMNAQVAVPNFFADYKLNDKVTLGLGFYVPYGLRDGYKEDQWMATDHGVNAQLQALDYAVGAGVAVTDNLSLGLEVYARNVKLEISSTAGNKRYRNKFELDDWNFGGGIGAMYKFDDRTRLGVAYKSRTQHQLRGHSHTMGSGANNQLRSDFKGNMPVQAPEQVNIGAFHKLNDKIGLSLGAKWTRWSRFKALTIQDVKICQAPGNCQTTTQEVAQRWKDAWNISVGTDYYYNENWTFRGGVAWDQSPIPGAHDRTLVIPDNDRWEFSTGTTYKKGHWTYDFAYMFIHMGHFKIDNDRHDLNDEPSKSGHFKGKYNMNAHVAMLEVQYNF